MRKGIAGLAGAAQDCLRQKPDGRLAVFAFSRPQGRSAQLFCIGTVRAFASIIKSWDAAAPLACNDRGGRPSERPRSLAMCGKALTGARPGLGRAPARVGPEYIG